MTDDQLKEISDRITNAHARIQENFDQINPVVGVNRQMRTAGIPADAMTIDCLKTNKRILVVFHDEQPEIAYFQFGLRDQDPGPSFETLAFDGLTEQQFYDWMVEQFNQRS